MKAYRRRRVVDGVSFRVKPGEVVGLLGPNGAGKTTSFNMVVGLVRPGPGRVFLDGRGPHPAAHAPPRARRAGLPAPGGVHLPQAHRARRTSSRCWSCRRALDAGRPRAPRADALLDEFGLEPGGRQPGRDALRRRAPARGDRPLASSPPPASSSSTSPSPASTRSTSASCSGRSPASRTAGLGVLITDHNVHDTLRICDRAYIIAAGQILEEGTPGADRRAPSGPAPCTWANASGSKRPEQVRLAAVPVGRGGKLQHGCRTYIAQGGDSPSGSLLPWHGL